MNEKYMKRALELAEKGKGKVNPNPMVGAVIVKDGKIIGEGYHKVFGGAHAEINAINSTSIDIEGSTLYVTLEPCSHFGKTPPCALEIVKQKFKKVVIGMLDPNPLVSGNGVKILRDNGIEVEIGLLKSQCKSLNECFIKYIVEKKPFVILKVAMSLDGKIADKMGHSKWITGDKAIEMVHKTRSEVCGIMVGIGTVLTDDPMLTSRIEGGRNPHRIIIDSNLKIPIGAKVLNIKDEAMTIVATTKNAPKEKINILKKMGVKTLIIKNNDRRVSLKHLMIELGNLNIDSILLEGGAELNYSAIENGIVDKLQVYISPKIIGGLNSKTPMSGVGKNLIDAIKIKNMKVKTIGEDIFIEGYVKRGD